MTTEDCARIAKAYDMFTDYVGINLVWWPDDQNGSNPIFHTEFFQDSACILQQLIASYEGWT